MSWWKASKYDFEEPDGEINEDTIFFFKKSPKNKDWISNIQINSFKNPITIKIKHFEKILL